MGCQVWYEEVEGEEDGLEDELEEVGKEGEDEDCEEDEGVAEVGVEWHWKWRDLLLPNSMLHLPFEIWDDVGVEDCCDTRDFC